MQIKQTRGIIEIWGVNAGDRVILSGPTKTEATLGGLMERVGCAELPAPAKLTAENMAATIEGLRSAFDKVKVRMPEPRPVLVSPALYEALQRLPGMPFAGRIDIMRCDWLDEYGMMCDHMYTKDRHPETLERLDEE